MIPGRMGIWEMLVFEERGKPENPEKNKTSQSKGENQKQTQLTYGVHAVYIATVYRLEIV